MFIDMRKELVTWLATHGHWVAVRIAQLDKKCPCRVVESEVTNRFCKRCLGTGKLYVDYLVRGDKRIYSPDIMMDSKIGEAIQGETRYYVEYVVPMKVDDYVLELVLNPATLEPIRPYRIQEAYRVKQVDDLRDGESVSLAGRLEFLQLQVESVAVR